MAETTARRGAQASRARRAAAQPSGPERRHPARPPGLGHRGQRLGQVDPGPRRPLPGAQGAPRGPRAAGLARGARGLAGDRSGARGRRVADRAHAPLGAGDLRRHHERHPHAVRLDPRSPGARLRRRPVLLQSRGRPLRALPRAGAARGEDGPAAGRLHDLRGLRRAPLQPRHAGSDPEGQLDRRRARHAGRSGARVLRGLRRDPPAARVPRGDRPRLSGPRPGEPDAVRRRGAAGQAHGRARRARLRQVALRARRADHGPAHGRRRQADRRAPAPRRPGRHGGRHRAQSRPDRGRGLRHRPRPRGRRERRPGGGLGNARSGCRRARVENRRLPAPEFWRRFWRAIT